jgi:hypothetical protein
VFKKSTMGKHGGDGRLGRRREEEDDAGSTPSKFVKPVQAIHKGLV